MVRPVYILALLATLAVAGAGLAATAVSRARAQREAAALSAADAPSAVHPLRPLVKAAPAATPDRTAPRPSRARAATVSAEILRVRGGRTVALRNRPGGRVMARLRDRTDFGSPTSLSVVARRGRWAAVPSAALGNGRLGWVDTQGGDVARGSTEVQLVVSLSHRSLELRARGRVLRRVRVAVGRPGSTTPSGRFSVTDKLSGGRYGPYYGCCILALSAHQPHTPAGWQGGDRVAIHGTDAPSTIGTPSSAGCLRAADADLRVLMRRVPLGTPVVIRG
jgi:lipoprotein-anchoring transpeptidase ErfK/SrfK